MSDQARIDDPDHLLANSQHNWQALLVFSLFRFGLSATLLILGFFQVEPLFLGKVDYTLFSICTYVYLGAAIVFLFGAIKRKPAFEIQANGPVLFDILALTLMMHLSGGLSSGLGLLLIIIAASHSLLAPTGFALLGASMATCAILTEQIVAKLHYNETAFAQAGLLGLAIFVTVLVLVRLKHRMHSMQQLAYIRGQRLATSLKLNTQVVAFMQEGVIVFSPSHDIQLINSAAMRMLGLKDKHQPSHMTDLPVRFVQALNRWHEDPQDEIFQVKKEASELRLSGIRLNETAQATDYVIFVHDISKDNQKAQHMKLALLGSLAANIAHEIRNPLSTVSHAAQLLSESRNFMDQEKKLVWMIIENCQRMNTVIKNVLNMSKRQQAKPIDLEIVSYMEKFLKQFKPQGFTEVDINYEAPLNHYYVHIDPTQLHQMLVNLCENGLRYSMRHIGEPKLSIELVINQDDQLLQIHILDFGQGIDGRHAKHMFEPFYTTESSGSGLGLYISREICQMNGGDIRYQPREEMGSDFFIQLPFKREVIQVDSA